MHSLRRILSSKAVSSSLSRLSRRTLCSQNGEDGGMESKTNTDSKKQVAVTEEKEKRVRIRATELSADDYKPIKDIFKKEMDAIREGKDPEDILEVPRETDVAIIGGGALGLATAYFMQLNSDEEMTITVIEKDPTYTQCSSVLSAGGIRQQFSLKENVQMSLFTSDFLRNIKENLGVMDLDPPDVQFNPQGYLFLASEQGQEIMMQNHRTQLEAGAKVMLMSPDELKQKFPWLNLEGVTLGSYGLENEGWFDPWLLLGALKAKCINMGVKFVTGEVVDFSTTEGPAVMPAADGTLRKAEILEQVMVRTEPNVVFPCKFTMCVNAAGAWAGKVAELAGIGVGDGPLCVPLPVEPRKRYIFLVHCPDGPGLDTPFLVDNSGVYVRREGLGGNYICGISPENESEEPDHSDLEVDHSWFEEKIWPRLAHRVPAFEKLKVISEDTTPEEVFHSQVLPVLAHRIMPVFEDCTVKNAWAGYYDYNYFDENLIIGNHPYHRNFYFATGCSGHGIQQALAIGRGLSEIVLKDDFVSIDLTRFKFDRIMDNNPVFEMNCV